MNAKVKVGVIIEVLEISHVACNEVTHSGYAIAFS